MIYKTDAGFMVVSLALYPDTNGMFNF